MVRILKSTIIAEKRRLFSMLAIALMIIGTGAGAVQANPLNLTLQAFPDITSDFIDVSYSAASQMLTARGFAEHIKNGTNVPTPIVNGAFEVTAAITNVGAVSSGTLTITGAVPSFGMGQGTLLTGKLSKIGYGGAGGAVELQFDITGGALAYEFGSTINVILGQSGFAGSFSQDFSSGSIAVAGIGW